MYVSQKDLNTISEITAFIDGALESCDGDDIQKYWIDFSRRANKLQKKMKNTEFKQRIDRQKLILKIKRSN